jgi:hypothetical protein
VALVVEDGTGRSDAESYLSVADANTYHGNFGNAAWSGTEAAKEAALRRATRYIDGFYRARWKGFKRLYNQALEWPRYDVYDLSGYFVATDSVPTGVKQALAEAALRELAEPGSLQPDLERGGAIQSESVQAGPVSTSKTYSAGATSRSVFAVLDEFLNAFIRSGSTVKLVRS